jgi:hypothetical protein
MKRFLLWTFERGSRPYDVMCLVILAFIFLTPTGVFNDRPDWMRVHRDELVRRSTDDNGNVVYTVQINTPAFASSSTTEKAAIDRLHEVIHGKFEVARAVPIYDTMGGLIAYTIWIEDKGQPF